MPSSGAIDSIALGRTADVAELGMLPDMFVNVETGETETASYTFRPEQACFAICQEALNCTFFTYDGLDSDRYAHPRPLLAASAPRACTHPRKKKQSER